MTSSYTLNISEKNNSELIDLYESVKKSFSVPIPKDLDTLFTIALNQRLFPGKAGITGEDKERKYIEKWISSYLQSLENPQSIRNAKNKTSCDDPAVKLIVESSQGITLKESEIGQRYHNLFMSAENIQGNLLEEYIAQKVRLYGIIWATGETLRAIDFCSTDGKLLLQIKNKNNSENSSSSSIRNGTPILKWFRLKSARKNGKLVPITMWANLVTIVDQNKTEGFALPPIDLSENDYKLFLRKVTQGRTNIISDH